VGLGTMGVCDEVHDIVGIRSRNAVHTDGGGKTKTEIAEHPHGRTYIFHLHYTRFKGAEKH